MSGTLYLVGTPIGNMKDITLRALDTLKEADIVAGEDTRHTAVLLRHYGIDKPVISYRRENERECTEVLRKYLDNDKSVAIVTDAGMPGISDPGAVAAVTLREAGYRVTVIPGPAAVTTALSLAGTSGKFLFLGFLPEKQKERKALIDSVRGLCFDLVFYCSPHDLKKNIAFLYEELGDRKLISVKELTKIYETVYEGTLSNPCIENEKGEFVLICSGAEKTLADDDDIRKGLAKRLSEGLSRSEAVKEVTELTGAAKNLVYKISLEF